MSKSRSEKNFTVTQHLQHERLFQIELQEEAVQQFFTAAAEISVNNLEYIPYMRFVIAAELQKAAGDSLGDTLRSILNDRQSGGFTVSLPDSHTQADDYVKFSTAVSHLLGVPNFDAMSGTYYARFTVNHTDESDSYLRQAYRLFTLHTDGTFVDERTDWLLMMKFAEEHAVGGESRILHLDDWEDLESFYNHPLATYKFTYKAPVSKNVSQEVHNPVFFLHNGKPCICFIDQFVYPETIEQSLYLKNMSHSLEHSAGTTDLSLPTGSLIVLNNLFWMHGRAAFEKDEKLHRELLRQRGRLSIV